MSWNIILMVVLTTAAVVSAYDAVVKDPCSVHRCSPGKQCITDEDENPVCVCVADCPEAQTDGSDRVCANNNVTFDSLCHLNQMRCFCRTHSRHCIDQNKFKNVYLDYNGACTERRDCDEDELEDFPDRLRVWFDLVTTEMAAKKLLPEPMEELLRKAEKTYPNKYLLPIVYKFCEMDVHPRNNAVTRREMIPLVSQIKQAERCVDQWLDKCDSNSDRIITLDEWGICLGLTYDEINEWQGRCDDLVTPSEMKHLPF